MAEQERETGVRKEVIMSGKTTTGAGTSYQLPRSKTVQIDGITTGTVLIQGSNDNTNWYTLGTYTADDLVEIDAPHIWTRANVSVATDVDVTVTVGYEPPYV